MLWRDQLVFHRSLCHTWQNEHDRLRKLLTTRVINAEQRAVIERRLDDLAQLIEPPVFDRPRR
jgi:hypothetical protein